MAIARQVGFKKLIVEDNTKQIAIPLLLLFPTQDPSSIKSFGPYQMDVAIEGGLEDGMHPLVIISHGSGGSPLAYRTLAWYLAKNGFIVGLPEHPFDNRLDKSWSYTLHNLSERPRHLKLVIDHILEDVQLNRHVDAKKVAVIGHSLGGYTALAAAGGQPNTKALIDYCKQPEHVLKPWCAGLKHFKDTLGPVEIEPDARVQAVVLLASDLGLFDSRQALCNVAVQILLLLAEHDEVPLDTPERLSGLLPDASRLQYRMVANAGHYSFLSPFPDHMKHRVGAASSDPPGFDRHAFHAELNTEVLSFLTSSLTTPN